MLPLLPAEPSDRAAGQGWARRRSRSGRHAARRITRTRSVVCCLRTRVRFGSSSPVFRSSGSRPRASRTRRGPRSPASCRMNQGACARIEREPTGAGAVLERMKRLALAAILVVSVGCRPSPAEVSSPSPLDNSSKPSTSATPTESNDASVRTACAARVLEELVRALNSGDTLALERAIGSGPLGTQGFQWVSLSTSSEFRSHAAGTRSQRGRVHARWRPPHSAAPLAAG